MKNIGKLAFFLIMLTIAVWLAKLFDFGITYYLDKIGTRVPVQYSRVLLTVIHPIFWLIINFYLAISIFGKEWKDSKLLFILTIFLGVAALIFFRIFAIKDNFKETLTNSNIKVGKKMAWFLGSYILILIVTTFSNIIYSLTYPSIYMYFTFKIKMLSFLSIILSEIFNIGLGIWMFNAAKKDSQNSIFWGVLGYFQGLLALIFYFLCIKKVRIL